MPVRFFAVMFAALAIPGIAKAQGLADLVPNLILTGITLPGGDLPGSPHAGHFTLGNPIFGGSQGLSRPDADAIRAVEAFGDRLRSQFANFPLGTSSGGFTFTFDEQSGTYSRASASFGPAFTERAQTIGRGRFSAGFNYQYTKFDTFGDVSLTDGSLTFYLPHTDCCGGAAPPPPSPTIPGLEGDVLEAALVLEARTNTFALLGSVGVTDRFDLGVVLPVVSVDLDATVNATIIRLATANQPNVHTFVQGQDQPRATFRQAGSATGIGDIVVRSKYRMYSQGETGFAAAFDLRLPTGDENDLLGLGTTQGRVYAILSSGNERLASHLNIGYTFSGRGDTDVDFVFAPPGISDEFGYAGGVEFVASPRLTIIGDLIGRTLIDAGRVEVESKQFQYRAGAGSIDTVPLQTSSTNPLTGQPYQQLALTPGQNLNLVLGAIGAKFNVATNLLISGNALVPVTKGGLRDRLTLSFGLDYAF
jgi:hypothetical protein